MSELVIKKTGSVFDSFDSPEDGDPKDRVLYMRFNQDSTWTFGQDAEVIEKNRLFVADIAGTLAKGWQCWKNGKPIEEVNTLYSDVEKGEAEFVKEEELRDHSPYKGNRDGWSATRSIKFNDLKSGGHTYSFQSSSTGARIGIENLVKEWMEHAKETGEYLYPVVTLGAWTMKSRQGDNAAPAFRVITWYKSIDEALESAKTGNATLVDKDSEAA